MSMAVTQKVLAELQGKSPEEAAAEAEKIAAAEKAKEALPPEALDTSIPLEERVVHVLSTVYDPEIPVNIYELGLIYKVDIEENNHVLIKMTLTAPNCPVAGIMPLQAQDRVAQIPDVSSAKVDIVWDPPWNRSMMSEAAQLELGFF